MVVGGYPLPGKVMDAARAYLRQHTTQSVTVEALAGELVRLGVPSARLGVRVASDAAHRIIHSEAHGGTLRRFPVTGFWRWAGEPAQ